MAASMQFGTFVFPNNPESLHMTYRRNYEMKPTTDGLWSLNSPARQGCIIEGEGVFFGSDALATFQRLLPFLKNGTTANLWLPGQSAIPAILVKLELMEEACEDYLRYRFTFAESPSA